MNYVLSHGGGSSLDWTDAESRSDASDAVDTGRSLPPDARRRRSALSSFTDRKTFLDSPQAVPGLTGRGFSSIEARLCNAAIVAATSEPPRPSSRML